LGFKSLGLFRISIFGFRILFHWRPFDVAQDMLGAFARDIPSFSCGSAARGPSWWVKSHYTRILWDVIGGDPWTYRRSLARTFHFGKARRYRREGFLSHHDVHSPGLFTPGSDRGASPPEQGLSLRLIRLWRKWACVLEPANWTSGGNTWERCER
jgi:hypothetical protein